MIPKLDFQDINVTSNTAILASDRDFLISEIMSYGGDPNYGYYGSPQQNYGNQGQMYGSQMHTRPNLVQSNQGLAPMNQ